MLCTNTIPSVTMDTNVINRSAMLRVLFILRIINPATS